jgi:hypothetical protein
MKTPILLPHRFKTLGWAVFLCSMTLLIYMNLIHAWLNDGNRLEIPELVWAYADSFKYSNPNLTNVLLSSALFIGLLLICFVKEKQEDEYISYLRLKSWQTAVLLSYALLFTANWLIYGLMFFEFMVLNLLTVPLVFIIRFNYSIYKLKREGEGDDE